MKIKLQKLFMNKAKKEIQERLQNKLLAQEELKKLKQRASLKN